MPADLVTRVRRYAAHLDEASPQVTLSEIEERLDQQPHRGVLRPTTRKRMVAFIGAALAVVVTIGAAGLWGLRGGDVSDPPQTAAVNPPPSTTEPTTPTAPSVTDWSRVGRAVVDGAVGLTDLSATPLGLIAVGYDPGADARQDGVVYSSQDGIDWVRLGEESAALTAGTALIYGVADLAPGLIAAGMSCEDSEFPCEAGPYPTVWTSADGATWTRTTIDESVGAVEDLLTTDHGVIAAGWLSQPIDPSSDTGTERARPAVWSSSGGEWERVWEGDPATVAGFPPGRNRMLALAVGSDGLLVGVGSAENAAGAEVAAVWTSGDGHTWERIAPKSPEFGSNLGAAVTMIDVASASGGFVAVGNEAASEVAIWQSEDGRSWGRVDIESDGTDATGILTAVAPLDNGWVAVGSGSADLFGGPIITWTAADGSHWSRRDEIGQGFAQAIEVMGSQVSAVGTLLGGDDFHAAIWTGTITQPK